MSPDASANRPVRRHGVVVRLTHWLNAVVLLVMLLSGLQIFNAHPALYWGEVSQFQRPWIEMTAEEVGGEPVGLTRIGSVVFDTTGVLGFSDHQVRGFPPWATLPTYRSLADGRRWHFFFAWVFLINGIVYWSEAIFGGRLARDLWPKPGDPGLAASLGDHLRFRFPRHGGYNAVQKRAYLIVVAGLLPLMLLTGLTMSPGLNAGFPWLTELFGGRQTARTIHFLVAGMIVLFVIVHLAMVMLVDPVGNLRAMIVGKAAIRRQAP